MREVLCVLEAWHTGGTEAYVARLGRWLHGQGHRVRLLGLSAGTPAAEATIGSWCAEYIGNVGLTGLLQAVRRRPAVVHFHLYDSLLPATLLLRGLGVRLVATWHQPFAAWSLRHRLAWRAAAGLLDRLGAVSRAALAGSGQEGRALLLPPCATPLPALSRAAREPGTPFELLGVGRLAREKDWPTLLRGFARFAEEARCPTRLRLLGDGPERGRLRELARLLGIAPRLELPGRVPSAAVAAALEACAALVLPSRFEGLPVALLEAMARGTPMLVADFPVSFELFTHGREGLRFPRGDWRALAEGLAQLEAEPERAARLGRAARERLARDFAEERSVARHLELYGWTS